MGNEQAAYNDRDLGNIVNQYETKYLKIIQDSDENKLVYNSKAIKLGEKVELLFDEDKMRASIIKVGFPPYLRAKLWKIICKIDKLKIEMIRQHDKKFDSEGVYHFYMKQVNQATTDKIIHDLNRTHIGNENFESDYTTGENSLYNVLNAIAIFDPEVDYIQGMNFIAAFILQKMNEENTFYMLIYIMKTLNHRSVINLTLGGLNKIVKKLEEQLQQNNPDLYNHMMEQSNNYMILIFIGLVLPAFCGNYPESNIHQIFDLFLLDGEEAIISVIFRML